MFIREALVRTPLDGRELVDDYVVAGGGSGAAASGAVGGGDGLTAADLNAAMAERSQANAARHGGGSSRHREPASIQGEFLGANGQLRAEIEGLEAKIRRRDVVVDEEQQVDFYRSRIPERVNSVAAFNHWRVEAEKANPRVLYMSRADLTQRDAQEAGTERFPDTLPVGGNQLPLHFKFEPAEPADGVTLVVPELLLDVVSAEQIAWLVPGMRLEKITAVFRALPKAQRKLLVPVPDFAKAALEDLEVEAARLGRLPGFHEWLAQWITQHVGSTITALELASLPLPDYLRINLRVVDPDDRVLAEGRDLLAIKRKLYGTVPPVLAVAPQVASAPQRAATSPRGSNGGVRDSRQRDGARAAAGPRGNSTDAPERRPSGGGPARGPVVGATGGAQPVAGADASSMAAALASAWGVSRPTTDARTGAGGGASATSDTRATGNAARAGSRPAVASVAKPPTAPPAPAGVGARAPGIRPGVPLISSVAADAPLHRQWDFGDVPEHRDVERNRLRLVVYPAVEDRGAGVVLVEARNAPTAEAISRAGIVRLAMLALPQQAKFVSKRVTDDRELILLSRGLSLRQSLADALTQRAFRECFLPADAPLPRTAQDFTKLLDTRRAQLSDVADRLATTITLTLKEWRAARAALEDLRPGAFADVVAEVNAQLTLLLPPDFIESTPRPWLDYLPRYFKAITRRIERLPPNVKRDAELAAKVRPFATALRASMAEPAISGVRPELEELRWMIEEFRVSLFAQELKTMIRVSEKRLDEQVKLVREAQR
jgi:ATP-dependent helicase HrpA